MIFWGTKLIDFYLDNGIQVLLWNYRGYGNSTGSVNFKNIKEDAEVVHTFLTKHYHWDKVGVDGYSIGGIPACHLAGKDLVQLVIADRTFSSVNGIIGEYFCGSFLKYLYKFMNYDCSENVDNIIKSKAFKVISCDPTDEIVANNASIRTGISKAIFPEIIGKSSNIIDEIVGHDKAKYKQFVDTFIELVAYFTKNKEKEKETKDVKNNNYDKLVEEMNSVEVISIEDSKTDDEKIVSNIHTLLEKFDAAGDTIFSLSRMYFKEKFITEFFMNMTIWGSYKYSRYTRDKAAIIKLTAKKLSVVLNKLAYFLNTEKYTIKCQQLKSLLGRLSECLEMFGQFYYRINFVNSKIGSPMKVNTTEVDTNYDIKTEDIEDEVSTTIAKLNVGHMICLNCGHNGFWSDEELTLYHNYLVMSKFV